MKWLDEEQIKPGDSIPAKIEEGLEQSRVLVLCMSANAFGSDWAQLEAGTFRIRDPLNKERRFIPLRLDDARFYDSAGGSSKVVSLRKAACPRNLTVLVEMTFALPEIEKADCESFTACGRVVTRDKSLSKFFPGKRPLITSVKQERSKRFVRVCFEEAGHLHLDIATPAYFQSRWKPKPTHTWPHIQGLLSRFMGQKIQVRAVGVFSLPFEKLPGSSLIRMLSVESKSPKVSMKLTGGTFSVSGAPIQRLSWSLEDDGKGIEVRLRSTLKATVNETYLVDLFRLLNESLLVLVLGDEKKPD